MLTHSLATTLPSKISDCGSLYTERNNNRILKSLVARLGVEPSPRGLWDPWLNRLSCQLYVRGSTECGEPHVPPFSLGKKWEILRLQFLIATSLVTLCVSHFIHLLLVSNAHACIFVVQPQEPQVCDLPLTNAYSIIFPLLALRATLGCYANIVSIQSNMRCLLHRISLIAYHWGLKTLFVIRNIRFLLLTYRSI